MTSEPNNDLHDRSTVPFVPEGTVLQTPPAGLSGKRPRRQMGPSKRVWIVAVSLVSTLLIVAAIVIVSTLMQEAAAEREALEAHYLQEVEKHDAALRDLEDAIRSSNKYLLTLDEADVPAPYDRREFAMLASVATGTRDKFSFDSPPVAELTNEETTRWISKLERGFASLSRASSELQTTQDELEEAVQTKREADELAKREAENAAKKASAKPISFEELFRAGNSLSGTYFQFEGKIIQDAGSGTYRVSITRTPGYSRDFWEDPILLVVEGDTELRLLEDDIITFVGVSAGVQSYESIFKQTIELPLIMASSEDTTVTGRD